MIRSTLAYAAIALAGIVAIFAGLAMLTMAVIFMILLDAGTLTEIMNAAGILVVAALVLGAAITTINRMSRIASC